MMYDIFLLFIISWRISKFEIGTNVTAYYIPNEFMANTIGIDNTTDENVRCT